MTHQDEGLFPAGTPVLVRFPLDGTRVKDAAGGTSFRSDTPRDDWPWVPGLVQAQCGADEWEVLVLARDVAETEDGMPAAEAPGVPDDDLLYPVCFRDSGELRLADETA